MKDDEIKKEKGISLYEALVRLHPFRQNFDSISLVNIAGAYSLKRQFAIKAGDEIARSYADIIMRDSIQSNPFHYREAFDFNNSHTQLAFWIDVLLHNCRGSLETLSAIIDYIYELKIKQTSFYYSLKKTKSKEIGISVLLEDIRKDLWFEIINQLRNKSYHVMLNTFTPKVGLGIAKLRFTIYFTVKNAFGGNLTHENIGSFMLSGTNDCVSSLELTEFASFITKRLDEYLDQVDEAIIQDCIKLSKGMNAKKQKDYYPLKISYMKLFSWRNHLDFNEITHSLGRQIHN